jgi:hypothetical protein
MDFRNLGGIGIELRFEDSAFAEVVLPFASLFVFEVVSFKVVIIVVFEFAESMF